MKTWTFLDKSSWGSGAWDSEPDKAHWIAHGLDCLILRGRHGSLCGYVGVPEAHPLFGKHYSEAGEIEAHGGLTFADRCNPSEKEHGICHPEEGAANAVVWWLGFDCAHCDDLSPAIQPMLPPHLRSPEWEAYRDFEYVKAETDRLAQQLAEKGEG